MCYSPWGCKESDITEWLTLSAIWSNTTDFTFRDLFFISCYVPKVNILPGRIRLRNCPWCPRHLYPLVSLLIVCTLEITSKIQCLVRSLIHLSVICQSGLVCDQMVNRIDVWVYKPCVWWNTSCSLICLTQKVPDRYQSSNFGLFFLWGWKGIVKICPVFFFFNFIFLYSENMMYGYTTMYGDGC